jgi:cardiolipin synthase
MRRNGPAMVCTKRSQKVWIWVLRPLLFFVLSWGGSESGATPLGYLAQPAVSSQVVTLTQSPMSTGNRMELLVDGTQFYPVRQRMIERATRSIDLVTFLWCDDESGLRLAELLAQKARQGVRVRIIIDLFNTKPHDRVYQIVRDAGIELLIYNPVYWGLRNIFEHSLHEKIMIVDGEEALLGSANLCDEYMIGGERSLWHDLEVQVRGPQVSQMQQHFDSTWNWMARTDLQSLIHNSRRLADPALIPVVRPRFRVYREATRTNTQVAGEDAAWFLYQQNYRDQRQGINILSLHELLIDLAQERIQIMTPYLVPPAPFVRALRRARERGVHVQIITNSPANNDVWLAQFAAIRKSRQLIASGVQIYEFQPRMIHAKAILIDGQMLSIGSHNFTNRSFTINGEANLLTSSTGLIRQFSQVFEADLGCSSSLNDEILHRRVETADQVAQALISDMLASEI